MFLKEYTITEMKLNTMVVEFQKCKVVIEIVEIDGVGLRLGWEIQINFIETDLAALYKHKREIDIEMITDQGNVLSGKGIVTAIEEKDFTEITGLGILWGYGSEVKV